MARIKARTFWKSSCIEPEGILNDQYSSEATFGWVVYSKRPGDLARAAIIESVRLDKHEVPQSESESRKKKDEENRAKQEKARRANKAPFRP
jgi:hypothetical protein